MKRTGYMSISIGVLYFEPVLSDTDRAYLGLLERGPNYSFVVDFDTDKIEHSDSGDSLYCISGEYCVGVFIDSPDGMCFEVYEEFNCLDDAVIHAIKSNYPFSIVRRSDLARIKLEGGVVSAYEYLDI